MPEGERVAETNVLVAVASRHGATMDIANAIAHELHAAGLDAHVESFGDGPDVAGYDAFVLGSAVYIGKWLKSARRFVEANSEQLAGHPTWLFSSGPIGDRPKPEAATAVQIDEVVAMTGAREHRLFDGRIDRGDLGLSERLVIRTVHAPEGDYRDWAEISEWARSIAAALRGE
jgi:menaquinone-dependent protoporphyrinogen oxidase